MVTSKNVIAISVQCELTFSSLIVLWANRVASTLSRHFLFVVESRFSSFCQKSHFCLFDCRLAFVMLFCLTYTVTRDWYFAQTKPIFRIELFMVPFLYLCAFNWHRYALWNMLLPMFIMRPLSGFGTGICSCSCCCSCCGGCCCGCQCKTFALNIQFHSFNYIFFLQSLSPSEFCTFFLHSNKEFNTRLKRREYKLLDEK